MLYERILNNYNPGGRKNPIELSPISPVQVRAGPSIYDPLPQGPRQGPKYDSDGLAISVENPRDTLLSPQRPLGIQYSPRSIQESEAEHKPFPDYRDNRMRGSGIARSEIQTPQRQGQERVYISLISPTAEERERREYRAVDSSYTEGAHRGGFVAKPPRYETSQTSFRPASVNDAYRPADSFTGPAPRGAGDLAISEETHQVRKGEVPFAPVSGSALASTLDPRDKGIQEYRAFRSRQKQAKGRDRSPNEAYVMDIDSRSMAPPTRPTEMELDSPRLPSHASGYLNGTPPVRGRTAVQPERFVRELDYGTVRDRGLAPAPRRRSASPLSRMSLNHAYPAPMSAHQRLEPSKRYTVVEDVVDRPLAASRRPNSVLVEAPRR